MASNFDDKEKKIDFLKDINKELLEKIQEQELLISEIEENHEDNIKKLALQNEDLHQEENNKNFKMEFLLKKKRWRSSLIIKREKIINENYTKLLNKETNLKLLKEELIKKENEIIQNSQVKGKDLSEEIKKRKEDILKLSKEINLKKQEIEKLEEEKKLDEKNQNKILRENSLEIIKLNRNQSDTNNSYKNNNIKPTINTLKKFPMEGIMKNSSLEPLKIKERSFKKNPSIEEGLREKLTLSNIEIDKTVLRINKRKEIQNVTIDGISNIGDLKKEKNSNFDSESDSELLMENLNIIDDIYKKKSVIRENSAEIKKSCCEFFLKKKLNESFLNFSGYVDYFN